MSGDADSALNQIVENFKEGLGGEESIPEGGVESQLPQIGEASVTEGASVGFFGDADNVEPSPEDGQRADSVATDSEDIDSDNEALGWDGWPVKNTMAAYMWQRRENTACRLRVVCALSLAISLVGMFGPMRLWLYDVHIVMSFLLSWVGFKASTDFNERILVSYILSVPFECVFGALSAYVQGAVHLGRGEHSRHHHSAETPAGEAAREHFGYEALTHHHNQYTIFFMVLSLSLCLLEAMGWWFAIDVRRVCWENQKLTDDGFVDDADDFNAEYRNEGSSRADV